MKKIDLTGMIFGRLKVIGEDYERTETDKARCQNGEIAKVKLHWICECELCGRILTVSGDNLRSGNSTTCGCNREETARKCNRRQNIYREYDDHAAIVANNTGNEFMIDKEDVEWTKQYAWSETPYGYLAGKIKEKGKILFLHRLIVFGFDDVENEKYVDHINRDKRDNRRCNLRECTALQNSWNRTRTGCDGRHVGLRQTLSGKWQANIGVNNRVICLGTYGTYDEALAARQVAENEYYGKFVPAE